MKPVLFIAVPILTVAALASAVPAAAQSDNYMFGSPNGIFIGGNSKYKRSIDALYSGDHYLRTSVPDKALERYQVAADLNPSTNAYIGLGRAYLALGEHENAAAAFRALYDGRKLVYMGGGVGEAGVLAPYALALSLTGRDAEALVFYRRAVKRLREEGRWLMTVPLPEFGDAANDQSVPRLTLQAAARVATAICRDGASWPTPEQIEHARLASLAQPDAAWARFYYGRALALRERGIKDLRYCKFWETANAELTLAACLGGPAVEKEAARFLRLHPETAPDKSSARP